VQVLPLAAWPSPARDYLSGRGVTQVQVERWGLGYAVDGRLAGRVVFPVRNNVGTLISYTARSFTGEGRRYLEPKIEEGADQGAVFGEEHWDPDECELAVVTEGAMDALAVERATGLPVAAVYGSQILPGHLARLQRWRTLILATDSDPAGDKAAAEISGALGRWTRAVRWRPPEGFDCASLAQRDPARLRSELTSLACPATGAAAPLRRRSDISGG
jgi:DNA primase